MSVVIRENLGNCAVLRLNRPEVLNSITTEMFTELETALDEIEHQPDVRAVILTGTGRGFCAGTDLAKATGDYNARITQAHRVIMRLVNYPKLTIAAMNGLAMGGGLELALACTYRVAIRKAKLGLPEINLGLLPSYGGTQLLPRLIGEAKAFDMLLSGEPVLGDQALAINLISALCEEPEQVVQLAHDTIQPYCTKSLVAQRAVRQAIRTGAGLPLEEALKHEAEALATVSNSQDCAEGVTAFLEKRAPVWKDC